MFRRAVYPAAGRCWYCAPDARRGARRSTSSSPWGFARSGWPAPSWRSPTTPARPIGTPPGWSWGPRSGRQLGGIDFKPVTRTAPPAAGPTLRNSTFASVASWPLGVSYGRLRSHVAGGWPGGTRWSPRRSRPSRWAPPWSRRIVPGLVVGSTSSIFAEASRQAHLAARRSRTPSIRAWTSTVRGENHFDFDIGLMADLKKVRLGFTGRNLLEPQFTSNAGTAITLQRLTRAGVAFLPGAGLTLAMDVDLDTVDLRDGLRRMIALGGEGRLGSRVAVRGGVRWNLKGASQPVTALGLSVSLRSRFWLEGYYSRRPARRRPRLRDWTSEPASRLRRLGRVTRRHMAIRLGELLLREKRVTPAQLQEALNYQRANGGRLGPPVWSSSAFSATKTSPRS